MRGPVPFLGPLILFHAARKRPREHDTRRRFVANGHRDISRAGPAERTGEREEKNIRKRASPRGARDLRRFRKVRRSNDPQIGKSQQEQGPEQSGLKHPCPS